MAAIRSNAGGQLLNQYLVARIFAFDDDQSEARAACVAKGWDSVRRGPAWIAYASERAAKAAAAAVVACPAEAGSTCHIGREVLRSRRFFCCTGNQAAEQATEQTANVAERTLPDPSTHAPTPSDRTRETRGATRDGERSTLQVTQHTTLRPPRGRSR